MVAQRDPEGFDYLAVVSEWSSYAKRGGMGGLVGNAYPLLNLTTGAVVESPRDEFPNPGAVFLTSRGGLQTWDFVVLRPHQNSLYNNHDHRQCYYIPARLPEPIENSNLADRVAVILDHPAFDLTSPTRQILNPRHNVTPIFFVRKGATFFGPLYRDVSQLSAIEDVQRIDWRPAREDGIVYELTRDELMKKDVKLVLYSHPDPSLNRILTTPIQMAAGDVRKVTGQKLHDVLPEASLIEWYLQRCPTVEVPDKLLKDLRSAFRGKPTDDPMILAARLRTIQREMANHAAFQEHRDRFARQYLESEAGQQRVGELVEQAVAKKAAEVQAEVDRRQKQLAAKRDELDEQLAAAEADQRRRLEVLEGERQAVQHRIDELNGTLGQIQERLAVDVQAFAERVQQEIPLFAALTAARPVAVTAAAPASGSPAPPARLARQEFRPVAPRGNIQPVADEARLVTDLHGDLARRGLFFARDFVANVYTCLKAEPLNLIIGPPGYGKSMLVGALARALGHPDAFLRIAVRRSWSEDRYLLGAFDSFHGRYDPGPTGLVGRMLEADADWRQDRSGIYVVLLDEFNLAAPEYYFSQLLQALPSDDPVREVVLYDEGSAGGDSFPGRVRLGPNLRFWGTINYDETTERLSPRTLDRTGMIFLGDTDVKQTIDEPGPPPAAVAASDLFEKFLRDAEDCPEDRWEIVSRVIDFLRRPDAALGPRVELSPRVRKAIKRYLANSASVLEARTAVDFVVQQRILPVVRGRGEHFFARMTRLGQLLSDTNLPRSASAVQEALRRSEQQFGELDFLGY